MHLQHRNINNVVSSADPLSVYEAPGIIQKEVKGIVIKEDGMPLEGVQIRSTGPMDNASFAITGKDGRFSLSYVQADASLIFSCRGYKDLIIKPEFSIEMKVRMEKDPDYKAPADSNTKAAAAQSQGPVAVIDGVISEKNYFRCRKRSWLQHGNCKIYIRQGSDR